jgi:hypothetical protein
MPNCGGSSDAVRKGAFDAALLDLRLGQETAAPVAEALDDSGHPFLFYTGQAEDDPDLQQWIGKRVIMKPADPRVLVSALAAVM